MDMNTKQNWENLSEAQQSTWIQHVIKFYPPNTVSPQEALELARDEYNESEFLLPVEEVCPAE